MNPGQVDGQEKQSGLVRLKLLDGKIMVEDGRPGKKLIEARDIVYEGQLNESKQPHGIGTAEWKARRASRYKGSARYKYVGEWRNGRMHGLGVLRSFHDTGSRRSPEWKLASMRSGEWKNGRLEGVGAYVEPSEIKYKDSTVEYLIVYAGYHREGVLHGLGAHVSFSTDPDSSQSGTTELGHFKNREFVSRPGTGPGPGADPLAKIVGNWKMLLSYGEGQDAIDYELRIARSDKGLKAVLVSPRSGEHKFKSAVWKDGVLRMEIERDFDGNVVVLLYEGRLSEKGFAGKMTMEGVDEFSGSWTAEKE